MDGFLPTTKKELKQQGVVELDFVLITGDAYVDHPSFAHAVISRYLVAHGYSVGIISQPDWRNAGAVKALGRPRLAFLISAGNMDSMVNIFTVNKKRRARDMFSPGGKAGRRPARSTQVYTKMIREAYGDVPVVIGGIEASLRRFAHYDYWDNKVLPSILASSGADLLIYGMGEGPILEVAEALDGGIAVSDISYVKGTVYKAPDLERVYDYVEIPSENKVVGDKKSYSEAFLKQMHERSAVLVQAHKSCYIVQNPPAEPLSTEELDFVYSLPYMRAAHPSYEKPVPALEEIKYSITAVRGCVGACSFCALYYHQGKSIVSRSEKSVLEEAETFAHEKDFKGNIHDVGGPTANMYGLYCANPAGRCYSRRCLTPKPCRFLRENHAAYTSLLKKLRELPAVKRVFIRSGIRHDLALMEKDGNFIRELAKHYVSGQLRLAPEHVCSDVLRRMGKPDIEQYERFCQRFDAASKKAGKVQYILPYFMSSHPGCEMGDAVRLAEYVRDCGFMPEQAQDFYPTPGTLSTCIYYTGFDPATGKPVYVEKQPERKAMQRALIQYRESKNRCAVKKALTLAGRQDLIGRGKKKLIPE